MALSLVCKDCNAQLRSVAEATQHNEATGHTNFEESTESVLNMVCTTCGKPCRSITEQDLHTKRTGHTEFKDKTDEAVPMDTEAQMKEVAASLKGEGDEESKEGAPSSSGQDEIMVEPSVSADLLQQLQDMGFSKNRSMRALHFTGTDNIEQAVGWIVEHEEDPDLDTPLLIPQNENKENKPKLSPEEAKKQAEEVLRKAREKREREDRELERVREAEARRATKELMAAQRKEEELRLKRNIEERAREKAEEARAREKIRVKLEEDRRERRRKLGLPEELTEEEKAAEAAKRAEAAKAKTARALPVKPISLITQLRDVLVGMKKRYANEDERAKTCWATLLKYCSNIVKDPNEEKFRKIRLSNAAFQTRVSSVEGSLRFLELLGFQKDEGGEYLVMPRDKVSVETLNAAGGELNNALTNPFFGAL
ncbi:g8922 [Coccomyxa elongata]